MALPKVNTPTYELKIPSTGKKVSYRPFLVKEEKTLLTAVESGDSLSMSRAMQDIITSCTEGAVNVKDLSPFDLEYFFLQLRGRSVGENIVLRTPRPTNFTDCCEEATEEDICEFSIDINDISVDTSEVKSPEIQITEDIGVKLLFPQVETVQKYSSGVEGEDIKSENIFKLIIECIDYIWDGDEIYKAKDSTKKELNEFLDSLSSGQFNKIKEFFESMPRLSHDVDWTCPKCEKSKTLTLTGIDSFFG